MEQITTRSFFSKYILDTHSPNLSAKDQKIAKIASIALGIVSFGTIHFGIWAFQHLRNAFWDSRTVSVESSAFVSSSSKDLDESADSLSSESTEGTINSAEQIIVDIPPSDDEASLVQPKDDFQRVVDSTPQFKSYGIALEEGHPCQGMILTGASLRPANFFLQKLFEGTQIATTLPGGDLFAFNTPQEQVREFIQQKSTVDPTGVVAFTASGINGNVIVGGKRKKVEDFSTIYGGNTYKISYQEVYQTIQSQRIYTSSLLPLPFYKGLKQALLADEIVVLPEQSLQQLKKCEDYPAIKAFLECVEQDPTVFGFNSAKRFDVLSTLSLYQIGSLVVKKEDYRIFMDGDGKIFAREPGETDAIQLINACGIRNIRSHKHKQNTQIMTECFKTALTAAGDGIVLFPAVGMGVWRGDPEIYWTAFFEAVLTVKDTFDAIYVNPGHQASSAGDYAGSKGNEFQIFLESYREKVKEDQASLAKLSKIHNLYESKQDLVQLAHNMKKAFPDKTVSLFNASDPDVTLGNHVGEYTNNQPHTHTTEENYTAMGTNGLCFEGITGVHNDPTRLHQVSFTGEIL